MFSTSRYYWQSVRRLEGALKESVDYSRPQLRTLGLVGTIGFPLFYFVWHELFPQPYDNLWFTVFGCLLALIATQIGRVSKEHPWLLKAVWLVVCSYCLSFFFTYMLLKNGCNMVWSLSTMAGLTLLVLVVYDWLLATLIHSVASIAALSLYVFTTSTPLVLDLYIVQAPIYFFVVIAGGLFNYQSATIRRAKLKALASVGAELAHELRTPLLSIDHLSQKIAKHSRPLSNASSHLGTANIESYVESLSAVSDSIRRTQQEIKHANTIIDMFLLDLGSKNIYEQRFAQHSACMVVETAVGRYPFTSDVEREKVLLHLDKDFQYYGSDLLLTHVLFNLIKNALAHLNHSGRVNISINSAETGNYIQVLDSGSGISAQNIAYIFDEFYTLDSSRGGTGIGLAFCEKVMSHFKGEIECESELGSYTQFRLSFPRVDSALKTELQGYEASPSNSSELAMTPSLIQEKSQSLAGAVLLLVDDHEINFQHICTLLTPFDIEVHYANDGISAVRMLDEQYYDAVLMDVHMPSADGCEVTERIREGKDFSVFKLFKSIPIIGVSGDPRAEVLTRCLNAGFNTLIHKPINQSLLVDILIERLNFSESVPRENVLHADSERPLIVESMATEAQLLHDVLTPLLIIDTGNSLLKEVAPVLMEYQSNNESRNYKAPIRSNLPQVVSDMDQQVSLIRAKVSTYWREIRTIAHPNSAMALRMKMLNEIGQLWRGMDDILSRGPIAEVPQVLATYQATLSVGSAAPQGISSDQLLELFVVNDKLNMALNKGRRLIDEYEKFTNISENSPLKAI